jgi:flagellar FliL protein
MANPVPESAPATSGGMVPMLAAIVSLLVGAAVGVFVVAPRLAGGAPAEAEAEAGEAGEGAPKSVLYSLQNVIVNPAGSQGQRFIVATVAFEVADEKIRQQLHESETQLRDAVTGVLEKRTVEELLRPGARDGLRGEFEKAAQPFLRGAKVKVFIPQFLVQ